MGKPPDADKLESVLRAIADGEHIGAACKAHELERHAFYDWRDASPENMERFTIARERGADAYAEKTDSLHNEIVNPMMFKAIAEQRRWMLPRMSAAYRERREDSSPIALGLTDVLRDAIARIPRASANPGDNARLIDARLIGENRASLARMPRTREQPLAPLSAPLAPSIAPNAGESARPQRDHATQHDSQAPDKPNDLWE